MREIPFAPEPADFASSQPPAPSRHVRSDGNSPISHRAGSKTPRGNEALLEGARPILRGLILPDALSAGSCRVLEIAPPQSERSHGGHHESILDIYPTSGPGFR